MKRSNYSWISYCLVFISALGLLISCPDPDVPKPPDPPVGRTFTVTISDTLPDEFGNTVTASPMSGQNGTEITVTVICAEDYHLIPGTLKYNNQDIANLKFILRGNVTITAQFEKDEEIPPPPETFVYDDIEWNEDTGKLLLKWEPVDGSVKYEIYHAGSRLGVYTLIDTVTSIGNGYTPQNLNPNKYENYFKIVAIGIGDIVVSTKLVSLELGIFGPDSYFYDSNYDEMLAITSEINNISTTSTWHGHWIDERYAFYFKPGTYNYSGNLDIGFYTSISGLGAIPTDTVIGGITCRAHLGGNNVTQNFWRSIENLSIQAGTFRWSVSQAAPARRMHSTRSTVFDQDNGWASGGFLSDSYHTAGVGTNSGQQFFARNNRFSSAFNGGAWHKTIMGTDGPKNSTSTSGNSTYFDEVPVIREKPFLYFDTDLEEYMVFAPALRRDAIGTSWTIEGDIGEGESILLVSDEFYIARPDVDTAQTLNYALARGQHIFFQPGRYFLSTPLRVRSPNTILLGTGYATLIPDEGNPYGAIYVDDVPGVTIASLMLDALYDSTYLLCMGEVGADRDHSENPSLLADLFFRVGGVKADCNADISALINSNHVIGDHFWAWRADHGTSGTVGWNSNTTKNGVVVTGDHVTIYGLFVEHYHEYEVLWLGEYGRVYFLQNERPYDSPATNEDPEAEDPGWQNPRRTDVVGWSAYKVANHVDNHFVAGAGMYVVHRNASRATSAIEVPNKPGVEILNPNTQRLSAPGIMYSIVNGTGQSTASGGMGSYLHTYSDGVGVLGSSSFEGYDPDDEEFDIPTNLIP